MMKLATRLVFAALLVSAASAQAGTISDLGNFSYWGGRDHRFGDSIGGNAFDIESATVTREANGLTIQINTNFAGHAGSATYAAPKGIGYGDAFLASSWTPFGNDAHHVNDNAATGTLWSYGLNLDNRWSNTGGVFTLYELNGATNAANVLNSEDFMTCRLGTQCYYRDGQATAVNTASNSVRNTGLTGTWSVAPNSALLFNIDIGGSALAGFGDLALHWG
ncbi:MAG: hypothetical protein WKG03_19435, partial [Telluria sp.]